MDPHPGRKHRRFRPHVLARLETLAQGSPDEILLQALERSGPTTVRELLSASGLGEAAPDALTQLLDEEQAVVLGTRSKDPRGSGKPLGSNQLLAARSWWSALVERFSRDLGDYHIKFPLRAGMGRESLRSGLRLKAKVFNAVMVRAVAEGHIADEGAIVRLPAHRVVFTPDQQRQVDALLARFRRQPYITPSFKECAAAVGEEVLGVMTDRGDLVQVSSGVLFLPETFAGLVSRVRAHIEREGSITLAQARDMLKTSRKYA
ncbi:MAG: selenocysteine-specific translation factor, partial [bacterium]|nr:selenocysteine-specific translation factor [bacterium]